MQTDATDIAIVAIQMVYEGLPLPFVLRVVDLARESEGVEDLVHLWAEAPDAAERAEVEGALLEALEDRAPPAAEVTPAPRGTDDLLTERRAWKAHLRDVVDRHGGVSAVARRAEMPQPSLSRLLNTMSEPRPATLLRLAEAMDLPVEALKPGGPEVLPSDDVIEPEPYRVRRLGASGSVRYGHGRAQAAAR